MTVPNRQAYKTEEERCWSTGSYKKQDNLGQNDDIQAQNANIMPGALSGNDR